jgi:transposase-like protein
MDGAVDAWVDGELGGCSLADDRLLKRLRKLLAQIGSAMGQSIPLVCQDWANAKAAYRFFANDRVSEADILAGHFQATRERVVATDGPILVLHDTTEFSYQREKPEAIGITKSINSGRDKAGRLRSHTVCGILMHSSLAVTTEGLPLGLTAVKFWTRKKFKGTAALKKKINPTRVPIEEKESIRWLDNMGQSAELLGDLGRCVHIGDRESDIYELFCMAQQRGTHFVVRTCVDRLAGEGDNTIADEMEEVAVQRPASHRSQRQRWRTGRSCSRDQISADSGSATDRKAETLSGADAHRDPCRGARDTGEQKEDRLEADHRSACAVPQGRY